MYINFWGTRCRIWLRHCATSRKISGSISNGVIGIFHWHNPSGSTIAFGLTQPLNRNEYQEYFLGVKVAVRRADNLTTFMCQLSWNMGASASWKPQGLSMPVQGLLYLYITFYGFQITGLKDDKIRSKHNTVITYVIHTSCVGRYLISSVCSPTCHDRVEIICINL